MMKRSMIVCAAFLFSIVASGARAADKIVVDYGGLSGFQSTVWVAKDLKLFDKHGIDADVIMITGGSRSVATLLSGSTQFATGSATAPLVASARGSDIKLIAASYNKFPYGIVARPDVRSPKDLRGKKIGILNFGGSNDLALQLVFREWNMKPGDVTVLIGGDAPTRLASMMSGRVDATILSPPHLTKAVQAGYRLLADMGGMSANFNQSSLYARSSYIREDRDRAKRFLRAYVEAVHTIKNDRQKTLAVFAKRMRIDDPEMLNATYDYFAPRFSFPPRVDLNGVRDTLRFYAEQQNPELKNRSPEEFVDHSLMDELEKEGFFKKLGG
jgi:NitT/TauT family transport system substrate-binding protein